MSLFGNPSQSQNQGGGLFGSNQPSSNPLGANNNKQGGLFGANNNSTNISFGANTSGGNSLFGNNTSSNQINFGANKGNQSNNLFGSNTTGNQSTSLFGQNNTQNANNQQNQNTSNILGNLSGINANNNQSNNPQQNNIFNQNRQNYIDLNNQKTRHDLEEFNQILDNVSNCSDPARLENMFKDYLYMPIPKGIQPNDVNNYRPYTIVEGQQKIVNDYNIWEKANKNNVNPNKYFPIQISSVDALLNRYKNLEKGILQTIAKTVETQKSLEKINKKVDDEMNSKISEIKNCHTRLDKLQLGLSSKVAQYNYLLGTAKENVNDTQQIKDNIKKTNDSINKNNMIEVSDKIKKCSIEEIPGETKNYIKELNKDKINYMFDALVEIQNMMNVVNTNNKRNLNIVNGMNKEIERILKKNQI
jgi:hypothetical protein